MNIFDLCYYHTGNKFQPWNVPSESRDKTMFHCTLPGDYPWPEKEYPTETPTGNRNTKGMGKTFHIDVLFHQDELIPAALKPRTLEELLEHPDVEWVDRFWNEIPACRDEHGRITVNPETVIVAEPTTPSATGPP